ncbi:MAG: S8 family serine peptidase [Lachnospiraceae bacterium]|nr:S8 family serine peptidase [Lachnospiraceae bacterium]
MRIAVVDDGIYDGYYENTFATQDLMVDDELNIVPRTQREQGVFSHATVCAAIIKKYCADAELVSIKVLDEESARGSADKLVAAIDWCAENNVRLVNASLGSTYIGDYEPLRKCINRAYAKGVIVVSAVDNGSFISFPALFGNVIGVRACENAKTDFIFEKKEIGSDLQAGEDMLWLVKSYDGIKLLARGSHELKDFGSNIDVCEAFNSYAAPFVTAMIAKNGCNKKIMELLYCGGFARLDWLNRFIYISAFEERNIELDKWFESAYMINAGGDYGRTVRDIIAEKKADCIVFGRDMNEADVKAALEELGFSFLNDNDIRLAALGADAGFADLELQAAFKWTRVKGSINADNCMISGKESLNKSNNCDEACSVPVVRLISNDAYIHCALAKLLAECFKQDNYYAKALTDDSLGALLDSEFSVQAAVDAVRLEKMLEKIFDPDIIIEHSCIDFNSEADVVVEVCRKFSPEGFAISKLSGTHLSCVVNNNNINNLRALSKKLYNTLVHILR